MNDYWCRYLANLYDVTPEHMRAVVNARRHYANARKQRVNHAMNNSFRPDDRLRAGEGELHGWLRALSMTGPEFCALVGMNWKTFQQWRGHSLWGWPARFLELYAYARNMERFLAEKGYDVEKFRGKPVTEYLKDGRHLRDSSKLVLQGLTPQEREQRRIAHAKAMAEKRWGPKESRRENPWKKLSTGG